MTKNTKKIELKRVGMNLPLSLVKRVEDYAYEMGFNVTSAYISLLNLALDQQDTIKNLPMIIELGNSLKQVSKENTQKEEDK